MVSRSVGAVGPFVPPLASPSPPVRHRPVRLCVRVSVLWPALESTQNDVLSPQSIDGLSPLKKGSLSATAGFLPVRVNVLSAESLPNPDMFGPQRPYVQLQVRSGGRYHQACTEPVSAP